MASINLANWSPVIGGGPGGRMLAPAPVTVVVVVPLEEGGSKISLAAFAASAMVGFCT